MSGGRFNYIDSSLQSEIFGWNYCEGTRVPNIFEDREISELIYDVLNLIHEFDLYDSGDTGKDKYLQKKAEFKRKWLNNRGVRVKYIVDHAIDEVKQELYETYGIKDE